MVELQLIGVETNHIPKTSKIHIKRVQECRKDAEIESLNPKIPLLYMHTQTRPRINNKPRPIDIASTWTAQENDIIHYLLRDSRSLQWKRCFDRFTQFWRAREAGLHHWRVDPGRTDGVDADVGGDEIDG